jgi:hypothetical protein
VFAEGRHRVRPHQGGFEGKLLLPGSSRGDSA